MATREEELKRRFTIARSEVNMCLRALSMCGVKLELDLVERRDPHTGGTYTEIIVSSVPGGLSPDDSG